MTVTGSKIRAVIFVPVPLAERCAALATRHRASRSEVYRLAIEHGLKHVRPALRRLERQRPETYRPARGGGSKAAGRGSRSFSGVSTEAAVYNRLLSYGQSYLSVSPDADRDDVRVALATEAKILEVGDDGVGGLLDDVLGELFSVEGSGRAVPSGDPVALPPD